MAEVVLTRAEYTSKVAIVLFVGDVGVAEISHV